MARDAIVLVEWADKAPGRLPKSAWISLWSTRARRPARSGWTQGAALGGIPNRMTASATCWASTPPRDLDRLRSRRTERRSTRSRSHPVDTRTASRVRRNPSSRARDRVEGSRGHCGLGGSGLLYRTCIGSPGEGLCLGSGIKLVLVSGHEAAAHAHRERGDWLQRCCRGAGRGGPARRGEGPAGAAAVAELGDAKLLAGESADLASSAPAYGRSRTRGTRVMTETEALRIVRSSASTWTRFCVSSAPRSPILDPRDVRVRAGHRGAGVRPRRHAPQAPGGYLFAILIPDEAHIGNLAVDLRTGGMGSPGAPGSAGQGCRGAGGEAGHAGGPRVQPQRA